eukprot:TRINITY_DN5370_c0_g2_i1.p1 TRINITY_DN5370_c0_g2~~TRINITY_DN5370_c0_g2_i1.p1  ORF type:complete len:963 (+),score=414.77 TRINITY_DN5370_c0_g2_i1:81-2969(+)
MSDGEAVQVAVRMRPFNDREKDNSSTLIIRMKNEQKGSRTWIKKPDGSEREYEFDFSFQTHSRDAQGIGPYADQNTVFDTLGMPVLKDALEGKNICLFAYGQTGAGKSFSMLGKEHSDDPELQGIIPRTCTEIFRRRDSEADNPLVEYSVGVQVVEVYREMINDLLAPRSTWPKHGHKPKFLGPSIGYSVETVKIMCESYKDIQKAFDFSNKNRSVAAHALNQKSSRGHTIYMITYQRTEKASADATTATTIKSQLNLVDLAGSERTDKAGTTGEMLAEGNAINKSLTSLGNCINVLSQNRPGKPVPFNDSKLTRLLQGAMTNGRVIMIAAISPASICMEESISTLEFAKRIKSVKIKASKNITTDPLEELQKAKEEMEKEMQSEIDRLKAILQSQGKTDDFVSGMETQAAERHKAEEERKKLQEQLEEERIKRQEMQEQMEKLMEAERVRKEQTQEKRLELQRQETMRVQRSMDAAMESELGISPGKSKGPFLSNLNEDPRLSGVITFPIVAGPNVVGTKKQDGRGSIVLRGSGVLEEHCVIEFDDSPEATQVLLTHITPGARVLVNGAPVHAAELSKEPKQLIHNTRVWVGSSCNVFLVQTPGSEQDCEPGTEGGVTYDMAVNEAEKLDSLEEKKKAALSSGDFARAESLQKQMGSFHKQPASYQGPTVEELEAQKAKALAEEDFEEVARVQRLLQAAAPSVMELEQRKQHAIANENFAEAARLTELIKSRKHGSWRAAPNRQIQHARGEWGPGSPSGAARYDASLPPHTARDYQSAMMMGDQLGSSLSARPADEMIPMTARTRNAFHKKMMFAGRASVSLDFLVGSGAPSKFMTLPLEVPVDVPLSGSLPPQLAVNIYQLTPQGQPQKRFAVGERADFVVHVIGAKGIPEMFSHTVFCKYIFKWGERDSYKTPELKNTTEPNFDFKKRFAFPKMTEALMSWFKQENVLTFELMGIGQVQ